MTESIGQKAGKAGTLLAFRKIWGALVSFMVMAYLARILPREDFGIVAISSVLISFIQLISLSGISEYIIYYDKEDFKKVLNASFWINFIFALIIIIIVLIVSPLWANFYENSKILNILQLLVISFFFNVLAIIPNSILRKKIDYKPIVIAQTIFNTISNILQVVLAYKGFGVFSIVIPNVITTPLMTLFLYWKSGFLPSLNIGFEYWKKIFNYTKFVIGQQLINKLVSDGDTLIIGKLFDMTVLGVYNIAYQFGNLFMGNFLPIITNVSLPILSKQKDNHENLKKNIISMVRLSSFISLIVYSILALNSKFLIETIYGSKWTDSVILFKILAIVFVFKSISSLLSGIYFITANPKKGFVFTLIFSIIFIISIFITSLFNSILLTTFVIMIVRIIGGIINSNKALSLINENILFIYRKIYPMLIISIVFITYSIVFDGKNNHWQNLIVTFIYVTSILITYLHFYKNEYFEFKKDLLKLIPKR